MVCTHSLGHTAVMAAPISEPHHTSITFFPCSSFFIFDVSSTHSFLPVFLTERLEIAYSREQKTKKIERKNGKLKKKDRDPSHGGNTLKDWRNCEQPRVETFWIHQGNSTPPEPRLPPSDSFTRAWMPRNARGVCVSQPWIGTRQKGSCKSLSNAQSNTHEAKKEK